MFYGYFEHNLDDKGRLMIPKGIKQNVKGEELYVLKGFDGCLSVYDIDAFNLLVEKVNKQDFNKLISRQYVRTLLGSVVNLSIDKVGRIQIPNITITKYKIGKSVVVLGVGDHFEIWDKKAYLEYEKVANENFEKIAEELEKSDA